MLERQERIALLLLVAVAFVVVAAHGILTLMGKQPFAHPFSPGIPDGELVVVEGQVDRVTPTGTGGHLVLEVDNLSIFLPAEAAGGLSLQKGDHIRVYGTVQTYHGKKEVVVDTGADITVTPVGQLSAGTNQE